MPFQSKSQLRKFGEMVKQGTMTQAEFDRWLKETPNVHSLPERVTPQHPKTPRVNYVGKAKVIR